MTWNETAIALQAHYQRFAVQDRILLTGHSHQAWPDAAMAGQLAAFEDAARYVDDKWDQAFAMQDRLSQHLARRLDDSCGDYVYASNTFELIARWLSAFDWQTQPTLVTTDGEFHSLRRLTARLSEAGVRIVKVAAAPVATLSERLKTEITNDTTAVMVSSVQFQTGEVVPELDALVAHCRQQQVPLCLDIYHQLNIVPLSLNQRGWDDVFLVGGGYKYLQCGEGVAFLRVPKGTAYRPVLTGWYAEFAQLSQAPEQQVGYGKGGWAFMGATYDPTSQYRAVASLDFQQAQNLTPEFLRQHNLAQKSHLLAALQAERWPADWQLPERVDETTGGFLVIRTPQAADIAKALRAHQVFADARQDALRLGPAPYVSAEQLDQAVVALGQVVRGLAS